VSPRLRGSGSPSGDHRRARDLAALAIDEPLTEVDAVWLDRHLADCGPCRAIAEAYAEQRTLLRSLRDAAPMPPRDLWARTAAAIERERTPRLRRWPRVVGPRGLPVAPIAGLLVVAIAVGAGLLNGVNFFPAHESTTKGDGVPVPTPIAMAAGEIQFVTRGPDGRLELSTRRYAEVCPVGADVCGTTESTDTTTLSASLGGVGNFDAVISPSQDHIVVMDKGSETGGVFVVKVPPTASPSPGVTPTPAPATPTPAPATPTPTPVKGAASPSGNGPPATPAAVATPTPAPGTPRPPVSPPVSPTPPAQSSSPTPSVEPATPPAPSPSPSDVPPASPSPEVSVTPAPDGTLEIASGVVVVGGVSGYSADGSRFAFSARPADGSAGPDVYVWQTAETHADPVTMDHASLFASWLGDQLLVSRVVDGVATTTLVDPITTSEQVMPETGMWRPVVSPDHQAAVWWDGTLAQSDDEFSWSPDDGRLVLGSWPGGKDVQVLVGGPVADWQVQWDESGSVLALWITDGTSGQLGRLSLYAVNPHSGRVNLARPLLADAPAFGGFSLRPGQLAYSAPVPGVGGVDSEDATVEILAWSGDIIGHLAVPTGRGVAVVR